MLSSYRTLILTYSIHLLPFVVNLLYVYSSSFLARLCTILFTPPLDFDRSINPFNHSCAISFLMSLLFILLSFGSRFDKYAIVPFGCLCHIRIQEFTQFSNVFTLISIAVPRHHHLLPPFEFPFWPIYSPLFIYLPSLTVVLSRFTSLPLSL